MVLGTKNTAYRRRRIDGEDDAGYLLTLLNDKDKYPSVQVAKRRVLHLLQTLQRLSGAAAGTEYAMGRLPVVAMATASNTVELIFKFAASTGQYRGPALAARILENAATKALIILGWKGLLGQVRQCRCCDCRRWFFAVRADQADCSNRCYRKFYESTPEYKEKRNSRLRDNYAKQKEKQRKILAIVERERQQELERRHAKRR